MATEKDGPLGTGSFANYFITAEQCMLNTIYWPKACMLFMYYRITSNSSHSLLVKLCAVYTALGFLATELTLFLNCHPFSGYWTLPPPQEECATYFRYEVVQAVFNISSDLAILCVIIPLLWQLKMAKQDKLPLVFIFSLGFAMVRRMRSCYNVVLRNLPRQFANLLLFR
jgi:hypothetical protein